MSTSKDHDPFGQEQVRQELLEYCYGCHPEPERIEARLREDVDLQKTYREVKAMAGLLAAASKEAAPVLELVPNAKKTASVQAKRRGTWRRSRWFWAAAASLLFVVLAPFGNWTWKSYQLHNIERSNLRLLVAAPAGVRDFLSPRQ